MHTPYIDEVRKFLGDSTLELLKTIFEQSSGLPPGVPATRFRAKYPKWMDELHNMGHSGFLLKPDHTKDTYRVSAHVLPLIESQHASEILTCMEAVYKYMQQYYNENLRQPISVNQLKEVVGIEHTLLLESLCYMRDVDGWWSGLSNDFPLEGDPTVVVNEQVLKYNSFGELISRVYEWHYVNPRERAETWWRQERKENSNSGNGFFTVAESAEYPAWFSELDDVKKALIGEIDIAIRNALSALPTIGLRTLLERVMVEHIGEDGGFAEKLKRFEENGYVTALHADSLRKVLDVGHASVHRAYFPNEADVRTCVEVVKHLMHGLYALHPKVQEMSQNTPIDPRQRSKKS